jgi:hypothetical protein
MSTTMKARTQTLLQNASLAILDYEESGKVPHTDGSVTRIKTFAEAKVAKMQKIGTTIGIISALAKRKRGAKREEYNRSIAIWRAVYVEVGLLTKKRASSLARAARQGR